MEEVPLIPPDNKAKRHRAKSKRAKKAKKKARLEQKAAKEAETAHRRAYTVCISCGDHFSSEESNLSDGCKHDRNTCPTCLQRWVEAHLRSTIVVGGVKCPDQCWCVLTCEDLRGAIPAKLYARLESLVERARCRKIPGYRECMRDGCDSWQLHDNDTDGRLFCCVACGFLVCTVHDVPSHKDETCAEYDERMKRFTQHNEASQKEVERISKACPGCGVPIEKIDGCDLVTCHCGNKFCYSSDCVIFNGSPFGGDFWMND